MCPPLVALFVTGVRPRLAVVGNKLSAQSSVQYQAQPQCRATQQHHVCDRSLHPVMCAQCAAVLAIADPI